MVINTKRNKGGRIYVAEKTQFGVELLGKVSLRKRCLSKTLRHKSIPGRERSLRNFHGKFLE